MKNIIGCDLTRDMYMYRIPDNFVNELEKEYGRIWWIDPERYLENKTALNSIIIYIGDRITTEMVKFMSNLKWIHLTCVGTDKLNGLNELNRNIIVTNSRGIVTKQMVSTIIGFMFGLARIHPQCNKLIREGEFNREILSKKYFDKIQDVYGQTCLIVGHGEVGGELDRVLKTFDMRILTISRSSVPLDMLGHLAGFSDYVVNLLPLSNITKNVFNKYIFKSMKPTSYFINIGRGRTVVEEDLIEALKKGYIAGAGLDVFGTGIPDKNSELLKMDNVLLSPHMASYSQNYWKEEIKLFKYNLSHYFIDGILKNIVNF